MTPLENQGIEIGLNQNRKGNSGNFCEKLKVWSNSSYRIILLQKVFLPSYFSLLFWYSLDPKQLNKLSINL